jgi:hypothetical protein
VTFLRTLLVRSGARDDARLGLNSEDDRNLAARGPRPVLDPVGNPEHATYVSTLAEKGKLEELREDIGKAEDALAHHASPLFLNVCLLIAVAVEFVGASLLLRVLGVAPGERLPLSLALAIALIGVTAVISSRAASAPVSGAPLSWTGRLKRILGTSALSLVYAAFIGAITIVRVTGTTDEDASQVEILAQSLLLLATSAGPAWAAEWAMRKRAPGVLLRKHLQTLRRRLSAGERAHARAQKAVHEISRRGVQWDIEAARERARYRVEHRLETARDGEDQ